MKIFVITNIFNRLLYKLIATPVGCAHLWLVYEAVYYSTPSRDAEYNQTHLGG